MFQCVYAHCISAIVYDVIRIPVKTEISRELTAFKFSFVFTSLFFPKGMKATWIPCFSNVTKIHLAKSCFPMWLHSFVIYWKKKIFMWSQFSTWNDCVLLRWMNVFQSDESRVYKVTREHVHSDVYCISSARMSHIHTHTILNTSFPPCEFEPKSI